MWVRNIERFVGKEGRRCHGVQGYQIKTDPRGGGQVEVERSTEKLKEAAVKAHSERTR